MSPSGAVLGHVAEQAAHDLAAARLRQLRREDDVGRLRDRPDLLRHVVAELLELLDRASSPPLSVTIGDDRLAGHRVVLAPADRRLGDLLVVDERALDLDRRDPVAGDVHHVVDAAEQPEVAVLVDPGAVAGEVRRPRTSTSTSRGSARRRRRSRAASPATAGAARGSRRRRGRPRCPARRRPRRRLPGNGCVAEPGFERRHARAAA